MKKLLRREGKNREVLECMPSSSYQLNYGKERATLFKPHLSSFSGSDFIKLCFKAVKIDCYQLQPMKKKLLKHRLRRFFSLEI